MSNIDTLLKGSEQLGITLKQSQIEDFKKYKSLLKEWNEKINITAITEDTEIDIKHFLDSLTIFKTGKVTWGKSIIDIGTGGGFPGVPMKIIDPSLKVTLFDSLNKRLIFLNEVIDELKMKDITTVHGRAEEFGRKAEFREKFDIATSRAVASLNILAEYALPFVKHGGYFIAMKGPDVDEEIEESLDAIALLGGELEEKIEVTLPESDIVHTLLVIRKKNKTPAKYPRGGGKPKKDPL